LEKLNIKTATNPRWGPFWPRRPDIFMRSVIKKMLPRKKIRGKDAINRVHVYIANIPDRFSKKYKKLIPEDVPNVERMRLSYYNKYITLENLCMRVGWNNKSLEV
jgi:large subunit ribosomal protein L13